MDQLSPVIEQEDACKLLKCSPNALHRLLADGLLPGLKPGKEWVIPREAFVAAINQLAVKESAGRRDEKRPPPPAPDPTTGKRKPGRRPVSQLTGQGY